MKSIRVGLKDRSYQILVGNGLLPNLGNWMKKLKISSQAALVVTQGQIAAHYRAPIEDSLIRAGFEPSFFITPAARSSEASKSETVFLKLVKTLSGCGSDHRSVVLVALGGGVIGDLTGFAASVYRRGTGYVQVPTTLTAQVDSAIGGKTGIDLKEGKNLLGSFFQPAMVLSDLETLRTLPERHWNDGFAEIIKYGVIKDPGLFALLETRGAESLRNDPRTLEKVVCACARIKARIVEKDERDKRGIRIILNFGHTAGHAIEAASAYSRQYTHGEAVMIGMLVACDISRELGLLRDTALASRLEKIAVKFGLPVYFKGIKIESILKAMGHDKKSENGRNCFVLPVTLGNMTVVRDVAQAAVVKALETRKG